jgi:hypothetical protein
MGLLPDERCGVRCAFAFFQTFAKRLLFRERGIASMPAVGFVRPKLEWKLTEMPGDVASPRKGKIVYVLLLAVVRHTHGDRHGLVKAPKFHGYRHQPLVMTGC